MRISLLSILLTFSSLFAFGQYELPGYINSNNKTIKAGSLVIAMDSINQFRPGYFNMKAYGLITTLLENEIPVQWAIRKGKTKTSIATQTDFTANTTRIFPDTGTAASTTFISGPFIIDSAWVNKALPVISSYGNNINVYRINVEVNVDIRYTLTFKPRVCLTNMGGYDTITVKMFQEAGVSTANYTLRLPAGQIFVPSAQYSLISDQHYGGTDTARINPLIRQLTTYGGNMVATCNTLGSVENTANIMTTGGIDSSNSGISAVAYFNIDLPSAQFHGNLVTPNGDYKYWQPKSGSTFKTSSCYQVVRSNNGTGFYIVTGTKLMPIGKTGGILTYLPGHSYFMNTSPGSPNETVRINGRRIYMNHLFIPPGDSILDKLDFTTDVAIALSAQSGFAVKYEPFKIYVIASNNGPGRAKNITVKIPTAASGLTYASFTAQKGIFNPGSGIWTLDSLKKGQSDTLVITYVISQLGPISYTSSISTESYETYFPNNTATLNLSGVSRPDAVPDSVLLNNAIVDYYVKVNDLDEDLGPFAATTILQGPFHGSAILSGDTIQYSLGPNYSGIDSVLYKLCDDLPLCDSAWVYFYIPSALPIELGTFTGVRNDGKVMLQWNTLSEKDNDQFRIYGSSDGRNFTLRGIVKGAGNSNAVIWYHWNETDDGSPILYYKLIQVDFNGKLYDNGTIALPKKKRAQPFTIIPNPADDEFILKASNVDGKSEFTLTDLSGRIILRETIEPDSDNRIFKTTQTEGFASGLYIATLRSSGGISSIKLMIR